MFPFSNLDPFPFEPKEIKIREDIFSEMKEREESSLIFIVGERIYNVKFNMTAQTWLKPLLAVPFGIFFFLPGGGLGPKVCVGNTLMIDSYQFYKQVLINIYLQDFTVFTSILLHRNN